MISTESIAALRFGYGFRPGEAAPQPAQMLAGVRREAKRAAAQPSSLPERVAAFDRYALLARPGMGRRAAERDAALAALQQRFSDDKRRRLAAAAFSPHGFYERLVWFWADHFSVSARGLRAQAIVPAFEPDAIRPHVAGRFGTLLRAAIEHPALLEYFGQVDSVGPSSRIGMERGTGLNENLGREVLELHTLGVGADYGQADVRQFAELLTGLSVDHKTGSMVFRPWIAEPGPEVVLGRRYGLVTPTSAAGIDDALEDLAVHPATARHIARKLAVHFVADDPEPDLVAQMEETFRRTDGDLSAVYAAMLDHPASWRGLGAKVRQPFDYVAATLRAVLPRRARDLDALRDTPAASPVDAVGRMNQPIWFPAAANGWPEAPEAWITPPGLIARLDWASRLGASVAHRIDPRPFVRSALGEVARRKTRFAAEAAGERWEGIALVLASPEFNRR